MKHTVHLLTTRNTRACNNFPRPRQNVVHASSANPQNVTCGRCKRTVQFDRRNKTMATLIIDGNHGAPTVQIALNLDACKKLGPGHYSLRIA